MYHHNTSLKKKTSTPCCSNLCPSFPVISHVIYTCTKTPIQTDTCMCKLSLSHTAKRHDGTQQIIIQTCKQHTYAHACTHKHTISSNRLDVAYIQKVLETLHAPHWVYLRSDLLKWHRLMISCSYHRCLQASLYRHLDSSSHWYSLCEMICLSHCIHSHIISITMLIYNIWQNKSSSRQMHFHPNAQAHKRAIFIFNFSTLKTTS